MFKGNEDSIIVTNEGSVDKEFDESVLQNSMKFQTVDHRLADSLDTGGSGMASAIASNEYSARQHHQVVPNSSNIQYAGYGRNKQHEFRTN